MKILIGNLRRSLYKLSLKNRLSSQEKSDFYHPLEKILTESRNVEHTDVVGAVLERDRFVDAGHDPIEQARVDGLCKCVPRRRRFSNLQWHSESGIPSLVNQQIFVSGFSLVDIRWSIENFNALIRRDFEFFSP